MIGFGFMISRYYMPFHHLEPFQILPVYLLTALIILSQFVKDPTPICLVSLIGLLIAEKGIQNILALSAVLLFLITGLVVGQGKGYILGIRRVNLFHYLLGISMVMFGQALLI